MFVGRRRELETLRGAVEEVRGGEGRFIIVEGPAGIGKSVLLNRVKDEMKDFQIFSARGTVENSSRPYFLFTQALKISDVRKIQERHADYVATAIALELKNRKGHAILIDEKRGIISGKLYRKLGGGLKVSAISREDVYLTELDVENGYDPYELESRILDRVLQYIKDRKRAVILIEGLNYLTVALGQEKLSIGLRDIIEHLNAGLLICTGDLSAMERDLAQKISAIFHEVYHFGDTGYRSKKTLRFTTIRKKVGTVFSENDGDYIVSESSALRPSMLRFKLMEEVINAVKKGDITLNCIRELIDYNSVEDVYLWLKYIRDIAELAGHSIYVYAGELSSEELIFFDNIVDEYINPHQSSASTYEFYEVAMKYLERMAETRPMALIMEDVQWADMNSLKLLDYIARNTPEKVLVVITYRGEEVAFTQKATILRDMREYDNTYFMRLGPLTKEEALAIFATARVDEPEEMYRRSGGNPLLIKEMLKYMHSNSDFVPDTIRESVEHQVMQLDDSTLLALRMLSVLGSSVPADIAKEYMAEAFLQLTNARDFVSVSDRVSFNSTVVWEYVYSTTPPDLKARFHKKAGELYSEKDVFMAAYHFYRAREREAIHYLVKAGDSAMELNALENAMLLYKQALEISEKYGEDRVQILEKLADVEELTGRYKDAIEHYTLAIDSRENERVILKLARCHLAAGDYNMAREYISKIENSENMEIREQVKSLMGTVMMRTGDMELGEKYYREFLEYAMKMGRKRDISQGYLHLATLMFHQSKYRESLEFARKAMENAEKEGDYQQIIAVYNLLGVIYDVIGKPLKALEKYRMVQQLAEKAGDLKGMALAYNNMGILYYTLGNLKMVKNNLEKALELHQRMGDRRSLALSYYNLSGVYADLGNFKKAEEYAEKAMTLYRSMGNVHYQAFTEVWLGLYKMRTMEFADAFKHIKSALDTANKTNHPKLKFMGTVALSKVHLKMGDCRKALETLSSLTPLTDEMKKDVDAYPEYLLVRYEALVKCGNFDEAKRVGEEIEEILKWNHDRYFLGVYMVTKAVHAVLDGRDGTEYFKIGISHIRKQGYIASYAEMQYEYGRALHRMKKIDAEKHLKIAMQMFRDMNLPAMVADIKNMCGEC